jgi:hypothetical protein
MLIPIFTAESAEFAEQKWRVETSLRPEWSVLCGMKDLYPCHGDSGGREICIFISPQSTENEKGIAAHAKIAKKTLEE